MGYETNIDLVKLLDAVAFVSSELKKEVGGRMTPWFKKNLQIA
jgi:hypothetical protein